MHKTFHLRQTLTLLLTFGPVHRKVVHGDGAVEQAVRVAGFASDGFDRPRSNLHDELFCVCELFDRNVELFQAIDEVLVLLMQLLNLLI